MTAAPIVRHNAAGTDLIAPLVVLQLSDLHFGPHSRFAGCDLPSLAAQCRQELDEARGDLDWHEPVALVLVSGDIAEAARPPEYDSAAAFFAALAQELALPTHRFVFVPGNHDVSWTKCREVEGQLADGMLPKGEFRTKLDDIKLTYFESFVRNIHGGKARDEVDGAAVTSLGHGGFLHDFADLGVSVAALNSCERESHRAEDHIGALGQGQAQALLDHWSRSSTELIRIAVVHHNPAAMASPAIEQWLTFLRGSPQLPAEVVERIATNFVGFEGHQYLRNLAGDAHASLILHGHHHASSTDLSWPWRGRDPGGAGDARIISAGSWGLSPESGKLPKDQPVVMQLIRLDPAEAQLRAVLLTYDPSARLAGQVHPGRFVLDARTRAERPLGLSLPPALRGRFRSDGARGRAAVPSAERLPRPEVPDVDVALSDYRRRKSGSFERWDLRATGPSPTVGNRPAETKLDDMYIPLRFAPELDARLDRGAPLTPGDLLELPRPQVVVGGAGSGKTTWMRWTFRRLVRDPRVVPFFLELRTIAATRKTPQDARLPIDSYLAAELTECGVTDAAAVIVALLRKSSGLKPVVLIDGWDELGPLGERMRERLVEFCRRFPHAVVVVSSRPYGDTRPAGAEDFDTVYIQPLSDDEVRLLATHFHRRVHGLDQLPGARETDEFMAALAAAPDARSLASTALLLTMMLLLSREGPLPDRRHELYNACLRNMLVHRVDLRERERDHAVIAADQWRPGGSQELLRVVAALAYRMQADGYKNSARAAIVRSWNDAIRLLASVNADKPEWTPERCEWFLRWLVAGAGVLVDRADGSVHFAHLSFQEHLAAHYLHAALEGPGRVEAVSTHMTDRNWWETLRLSAGLTGDQWPDKLSPVLATLRPDPEGYWLAGMIFADGAGTELDFEAWCADLPARLSDPFGSGDHCARAWGACKQSKRRTALAARLESSVGRLHWLEATWHADWCQLANLRVAPAPALLALETRIDSAHAAARSRALLGSAASWPDGGDLAVLRLWPSIRASIGVRLQAAISVGASLPEITAMFPALLARAAPSWNKDDHDMAEDVARRFSRDFVHDFVQRFGREFGREYASNYPKNYGLTFSWNFGKYFVQDFGRYFVRDFGKDFAKGFWQYFIGEAGKDFAMNFVRDFGQYVAQYTSRDLGWDFVRFLGEKLGSNLTGHFDPAFVRDFGRYLSRVFDRYFGREKLGKDFVRSLVRDFASSEPMVGVPWLSAFALLEAGSIVGRAAPRAALAYGGIPPGAPLLALFRVACQASFSPYNKGLRTEVSNACRGFDGDTLWPALARHVARIEIPEDFALLEDLARHPERREGLLSWGLQYYVRGDLVFDDDSVVTLDELCAQADLPSLPLLQCMPDELDIGSD